MKNRLLTLSTKAAPVLVLVLVLVGFSALHARRACDEVLQGEIAPPPRYSTRFVLYPSEHMEGANELGFKPGWVVTYAPHSRQYGTAFFVTLTGKMLARGKPSTVALKRKQDDMVLELFRDEFSQRDRAAQVGSMISNVVSVLGAPHSVFTNSNGSILLSYHYEPPPVPVDLLTNGFSLVVSNDIVVEKGHSFTSSR